MPDPSSLRRALAGVVTSLVVLVTAATGATAHGQPGAAEDADLLVVHLDTITPVAREGRSVRMTGTVTNTTAEPWTRVNLHAFGSESPILDASQLAVSAETDPHADVGPRVTEPGTFDTVDVLEAGQTAEFSLSVPVAELGFESSGVYWVGVHALGDSSVPRDTAADGRARTFIPFLSRPRATVPVSVVLTLRGPVRHSPDGRLAGTGRWSRALAEGGRYDALLDAAEQAGATPHSMVVDPAVLVAISRLTIGNPPRTLAPDPTVPGQEPPPPEEEGTGGTPVVPPVATTTPPTPDSELGEEELALANLARTWMARFLQEARTADVLALPFGDLDVAAAARLAPDRYTQAVERSRAVMESLELAHLPVVAPVNGLMSPEGLAVVEPGTTVMLGDTAFSVPPESDTSLVRLLGHRVLVTSTGAATGGPGPTDGADPLAVRQRLVSEAALRLPEAGADRTGQPLVLVLPPSWRAEQAGTLLDALEQPWIEPVTATELASGQATASSAASLVYTEEDAAAELDADNFARAEDLTDAASVMEAVLTLETTVEQQVLDEALTTLSLQRRRRPREAARSAAAIEEFLRDELDSIRIDTRYPTAVTLSSDSGPFGVTLTNGLDQPVTVALRVASDDEISLDGTGVRQLAAGSRTQARLQARTTRPGVHTVRLFLTSEEGTPLGSSRELPIRAAQVSGLIWLAMAVGAVLLFGAIALRLWRRVRRAAREARSAHA
ncbi:hypothetical protein EXE58_08115 [Nocardioides seonyuensis]|uniref:Glycoprotein n=1 Tax=Nocardioides seonyuensis TaxID=2518371 RepID=A0A4P7IHW4_9ACTN|nr:DUF6049 family protein [Nocardioides seonyuensis]QBX55421.1 hypothetical protein EXE58_08115 [Nocardioides seonyuensis]